MRKQYTLSPNCGRVGFHRLFARQFPGLRVNFPVETVCAGA